MSTADIDVVYCDHCGEPVTAGDHATCRARRELEPPRYCPFCRRRMVVQVVPRGWTARCSEHGPIDGVVGDQPKQVGRES